jgi:hypothetical protein
MKVSVKLNKIEKKKLARLKREMKSTHAKMLRTYDAVERAWKKGKKASTTVVAATQDASKRAKKATTEAVQYYSKLRKKYSR